VSRCFAPPRSKLGVPQLAVRGRDLEGRGLATGVGLKRQPLEAHRLVDVEVREPGEVVALVVRDRAVVGASEVLVLVGAEHRHRGRIVDVLVPRVLLVVVGVLVPVVMLMLAVLVRGVLVFEGHAAMLGRRGIHDAFPTRLLQSARG
jgi:hypothetical protein